MICYLLSFPSPVGLEPHIYLNKPTVNDESIEICDEDGFIYSASDPMCPSLIECPSIGYALNKILSYNKNDEYLKEIEIVEA